MKVLIVSPFYYPNLKGGSELTVKLLAELLVKKGVSVSVISLDGEKAETKIINGVKLIRLKKISLKPITLSANINLLLNLSIVKKEKPDVIHIYNTWNTPSGLFLRRYSPVVATLNNYFPLCPIDYFSDDYLEKGKTGFFKLFKGIKKNIKGGFLRRNIYSLLMASYGKINLSLTRKLDGYIIYANAVGKIYKRFNFPDDRFKVIPNLIEPTPKRLYLKKDKTSLLFVGDLSKAKGFDELFEAMRLLKGTKIKLLVAAKVEEGNSYKEIIKKENLPIEFLGWLNREKMNELYAKSSLLVHPSQWPEPFSRVWLEATSREIPIISSDNPVAKEVLKDYAIFYKRGNSRDLSLKIKEFFFKSKKRKVKPRRGLSIGLLPDEFVEKIVAYYTSLISERNSTKKTF